MTAAASRGIAAAGTVALAAAINVATGMLTQHWATAWWLSVASLVFVGGGLQWWLTAATAADTPSVRASGAGAVAAGRCISGSSTKVRITGSTGVAVPAPSLAPSGVTADGPGAVAAGQDIRDVETDAAIRDN